MIDLYGMGSPNVLKIAIALEEMDCPYRLRYVRVTKSENFSPEFLALNPIGKVPVIVDDQGDSKGQPIFESGAILIYLAERYGSEFLSASGPARWEALKWLMFQVSYAGPMLGQVNHFQFLPSEESGYAWSRFKNQAEKIYGLVERRLTQHPWMGGDRYSIADMAMYPWAAYLARHGFDPSDYPYLISWRDRLDAREPVRRAVATIRNWPATDPLAGEPPTQEQWDAFFGRSKSAPNIDRAHYLSFGSFFSVEP
jgi:GST-like protein